MTPAAAWVLVALAAVLVGAAIPALVQLRRTLKAAQETLESTGRQVNEALGRLTITLERVNRTVDELERGVNRASSLFEALGGIGDALGKVASSVVAMASLGSALGGALRAAFGVKSPYSGEEPDRPEPSAAAATDGMGDERGKG